MPSYTANCSVTVFSNKNTNTYNLQIIYDNSERRYRIDYDNMSIILGTANAQIKKDSTIMSAPVNNSYMLILPDMFFKSYYVGENASVAVDSATTGTTLLECEIVNPPVWANTMKLWIDNKTLLPRTMKVYDKDFNEKINIEYDKFEIINIIDKSLFEF